MTAPAALPKRRSAPGLSGRWLIGASAVALAAFVWWASWAELDQITRAPGTVVPTAGNQVIQVMEQAMVEEVLVREGDVVRQGQLLVRFNQRRTQAAWRESQARVVALQAAVARLSAEVFARTPQFPPEVRAFPDIARNQQLLFEQRRAALNEDVQLLNQSLALVRAELELMLPLVQTGDVSQVEVLRLQRQQADLQAQIATRRNQFMQDAHAELARAQESLQAEEQQLAQHSELLQNTEIFAPMDGVVRNVRITTRGGVARAGEEVMQIVPLADANIIQARVAPADIGTVRNGLRTSVKFDAWDFTVYGSFPGSVVHVSPDSMRDEARAGNNEPFFMVHVKLDPEQNLRGRGPETVSIQAGMTATVEIHTGTNTVLRYLTRPITKTLSTALEER